MPDNPKMYYTMSEVCQQTGLKDSVLRHWEDEFRQLRPKRNSAGNRAYQAKDIELINYIKRLLYDEKLSIAEARKRIAEERREAKTARKTTTIKAVADADADAKADTEAAAEDIQAELPFGSSDNAGAAASGKLLSEIREGLEDVLRLLEA